MASDVTWAPIGTEIVSWRWVGVPDRQGTARVFDERAGAEEYAGRAGRVMRDYVLLDPDGATWSLRLHLPEVHEGDRAIGAVVVDRSYKAGSYFDDVPIFPTPEQAEDEVGRRGTTTIHERLTFRTPAGDRFDVFGALQE